MFSREVLNYVWGERCLDHSKKLHIKTFYEVLTLSKHAHCINLIRGFCIFFLLNTRKKIILQHGFNLKHMPPSRKKKNGTTLYFPSIFKCSEAGRAFFKLGAENKLFLRTPPSSQSFHRSFTLNSMALL